MFVRCHSRFVCHPSFLGNDCISFYGNHVTIPFKVTIPSFQIHFVQQKHKTVERMPSIAKKRLLREKYKRHLLSSLQKTISTQTNGSVFADRIEQVKKTKFEVEFIKIVDCVLDGYGNYDSILVSFKIESL